MHRGTTHTGKLPLAFTGTMPGKTAVNFAVLRKELEKLQNSLNAAVAAEEFERAVILRDKISELKERLAGGENK